MVFKKKNEEGKTLIDVEQEYEKYPVKRKNSEEPLFVWTTESPKHVSLVHETTPKCNLPNLSSIEMFKYIFSNDIITNIVKYTNERIDVEQDISIDFQYMKFYSKVFTEIVEQFTTYDTMNKYILEYSTIDTLKILYSQTPQESLLSKFLSLLIESPKMYIVKNMFICFILNV